MVFFVTLRKSGNSLVIVLPPPVREALKLARGDEVAIALEGDRAVLVKMDERRSHEILAALKGSKTSGGPDPNVR